MNCNKSESTEAVETFVQPVPLKDRAFIEIPCPTSWDNMTGNDSVRFCGQCSLNVYNISSMTDKEAEAVFTKGNSGERLCARLYRRPDGTVMTDNCPRALRKIRNASKWLQTKIVACFGLLLSLAAPAQAESPDKGNGKSGAPTAKSAPIDESQNKDKTNKDKSAADKTAKGSNQGMPTMGAIRVPTPAEQAELGKIAAPKTVPKTVAPVKVEPHKVEQQKVESQKTDSKNAEKNATKSQEKQSGGAPLTHKMGRIRVEPAAKPATAPKDEKAK